MTKQQIHRINLKPILLCLMLIVTLLGCSSCASDKAQIRTDEDLIDYLSQSFEGDSFEIQDSAELENFKFVMLDDGDHNIVYALLEKTSDGTFTVVKTHIQEDASHLAFLLPYDADDGLRIFGAVNNSAAKKIVVSCGGQQKKVFELDKEAPAAYLFKIDSNGADEFECEFQDADGNAI